MATNSTLWEDPITNSTKFPPRLNETPPQVMLSKDIIERMIHDMSKDTDFDFTTQVALIVTFSVLILFGAAGNGLVWWEMSQNIQWSFPYILETFVCGLGKLQNWRPGGIFKGT